jgi:glutamyl-Q tRNA(Asp) synthetase
MTSTTRYRGRFAPSPTGPLHFGSLVAAVGSFLQARSQDGEWLVRMEDLDPPREVAGAADDILRTLEAYGLHWDHAVVYQSRRHAAYAAAIDRLRTSEALYACACTRREIADSAIGPSRVPNRDIPVSGPSTSSERRGPHAETEALLASLVRPVMGLRALADSSLNGSDGPVYPGTCRRGVAAGRRARALRVRTDDAHVAFEDALQGRQTSHLEREVGDFVVRRADGCYAYQLAVVVDDAEQAITEVVRGADLLASTARQIHLQRLLGLPTPRYAHLPAAVNAAGEKLSKQTFAPAVPRQAPLPVLVRVLEFLGQPVPPEVRDGDVESFWRWAIAQWRLERVPRQREILATASGNGL